MTAKSPLADSNPIAKFGGSSQLEFHGATITSDARLLAFREINHALDFTYIHPKAAEQWIKERR